MDMVLRWQDVSKGDLLIVTDDGDNLIAYQCKEILNPNTGKEKILLTDDGTNIYFIWSKYEDGSSWVKHVLNMGPGNVHENAKENNTALDVDKDEDNQN